MASIEQLQQFVNEDPGDPFNLYALALEYQKTDEQKALDIFNRLRSEHVEYVPTYYHLGKLYQELSEVEKALQVFEQGIEAARMQNDLKALRELQTAKQELLFDT
jgi:tetratricopeptide (TPR) repeat protein